MLGYPMRYVLLFCTVLILPVIFLCVHLYLDKAGSVGEEKEFSTTDYLTWADWTQGIRDYIRRCTDDGERVACYVSLRNPERGEKMVLDLERAASQCWEQCWIPVKKLYDVVGVDRLITMGAWENVSFCRECVSPAWPPAPGAETDIATAIQTLVELVNNNHKEDSAEVQKMLEELYRLKQMYPLQFSGVIKTSSTQLIMVCYAFLKSALHDGCGH